VRAPTCQWTDRPQRGSGRDSGRPTTVIDLNAAASAVQDAHINAASTIHRRAAVVSVAD